jgi:arylsulfatase A-like enzyme
MKLPSLSPTALILGLVDRNDKKSPPRSLALAVLLLCTLVNAHAAPPNIVVMLADDAGWGDYSASGNRQISTPRIDSIALEGVTMDRFYVCPVCSPTRAEFLTGRYYERTGVRGVTSGQERLNLGEKTIADAFRAAGYATGAFGKWHNGSQWPYHPLARGFQEYFGYTSGHWGDYFDAPLEENGRMIRTEGYIVDVCTERALDFIDRHKDGPFFCYVPFTTPHSPWAVPQKYWDKFKNHPLEQRGAENTDAQLDVTRCALAMLENQDWNVGRILDRLRKHGIEQNTVVVYFSDNGPNSPRWNGGMKGIKGTTHEGGVRSICHVKFPLKIAAGRTVRGISGAMDLLPTLTALAGVPRVGDLPLDGKNIAPALVDDKETIPNRMIFSSWGGKVSVRTPRHRLDAKGDLFDMYADPGQTTPINSREPAVSEQLSSALAAWKNEMSAASSVAETLAFPVGYPEFPITILPARDGVPQGAVRRSSKHANSSYFQNWTRPEDRIAWKVDVHTTGTYAVSLDYTCPEKDVGSTVELSLGSAKLETKVTRGWDPPLADRDTLPRGIHGESPMKPFHVLEAGTVHLGKGVGQLTLRATAIPGDTVMDLRRITLTLLP